MTKIVLGSRPKSFPVTVKAKMLDGSEGIIGCQFKYRTKREFGQLIDRMFKDAGEALTDGEFSMENLMSRTVDKNADYLADVLDGWDLDIKLSRDALSQLADEVPAMAAAIMDAYRSATVEGRLGN